MAHLKLNRATNIAVCHFYPGKNCQTCVSMLRIVAYANMEVSTKFQRTSTRLLSRSIGGGVTLVSRNSPIHGEHSRHSFTLSLILSIILIRGCQDKSLIEALQKYLQDDLELCCLMTTTQGNKTPSLYNLWNGIVLRFDGYMSFDDKSFHVKALAYHKRHEKKKTTRGELKQ
jgi:hypothetical protein